MTIDGKVVQIAAGWVFTCALLETGAVRCWGNGSPGPNKDMSLGGKAVKLSLGYAHACAVLDTGALRCWGLNTWGNLGYGHKRNISDPAAAGDVDVGGKVLDVGAGRSHTCALIESHAVRCWGDNSLGQLGYGNTTKLQDALGNTTNIGDNEAPATAGDVSVGGQVVQLSTGAEHTCVLFDTGAGRCWGWGFHGRNGIGNDSHVGDNEVPSKVPEYKAGGRVLQISAQGKGTCALMDTGNVRCWGYGGHGTLGYGNTGTRYTGEAGGDVPLGVKVNRLPDHGGYYHSCVITEKGTVRCWGFNFYGQLGYGNRNDIGDNEPASLAGDIAF